MWGANVRPPLTKVTQSTDTEVSKVRTYQYKGGNEMSMYPVTYEIPYQEEHSRLTVFFRMILAIPLMLFAFLYEIAAGIAILLGWFALVFTGKYPEGLYNLAAGFLRYGSRVYAYCFFLTDKYPPFSGSEEQGDFPLQITVGPPKEQYSRAKAFFRFILIIPLLILAYLFMLWAEIMAIAAWFVVLFTGRLPQGIHDQMVFSLRFIARANAYAFLLTEHYPPISDEKTAE